MWKTTDYKGNSTIWYEAELIEKIKKECSNKLTQEYDITDVTKRILDLIQEYERNN